MNLGTLIKKLQHLEKTHGPRTPVTINWRGAKDESYSHPGVDAVHLDTIKWAINDTVLLSDGITERQKTVVVLE